MSPNESYPQHVVTAVIVAHDGATWLPQVADAVLGQTRPVQRVVAVDTGSRDRSGAVLASKFGQAAVFGMDRPTGYGAAIARALQHRAARTPVPPAQGAQAAERTEWLWLLHDDCEPAPDALEQLLRGTVEISSAAVLGPKIRDWSNRDVILEAGVALDTATRRVTGVERREVDQGQHDGDRDALAVSSAGMLVRRDVWEQVGGFDAAMSLFMDDIDFCWRVHAAGYRVRVITDAVVYHAQAASKRKRAVSVGRRARMLDRRNGLLTLLGNLPLRPMMAVAVGNIVVSLLRVTFFLLAKRTAAAMDELRALASVFFHPIRLISMRRRRARGRRAAFSRVRADLPPGHSVRRMAEFALGTISKSQTDTSGSHHATEDPTDDDSMLVDNGLGKRLLTSPTLFTFVVLTGISLAACRSLIGSWPLGGGSLVPAWGGSGALWASYIQSFHPSGIGSTTPAPPWLAVVAALATVLGGKPWLAIDVILIGCVPLSGLTAMFAVRKITTSGLVRVWVAMTYALLPVATGVIAGGRFGTAVAFILLPLIVAQAGRMMTLQGPRATRAAWATGLLTAIASAFVPLAWILVLLACVLAAVVLRAARRGLLRNLVIAALTPPVLLMPWTLTLVSNPARLLLEAGPPQSGAPAASLSPRSLLLLSPGGPGLPPYWVTGGLLVAAFAALFAGRRRRLVVAGWGLALCALLAAVLVSHLIVRTPDGSSVTVWAGLPLALAAIGLLMAVVAGASGLARRREGAAGARPAFGGGNPWTAVLGLAACTAPVLAAVYWLSSGVGGPVHQVSSPVVPELVAAAGGHGRQVRTLVLRSAGGHVSFLLLRGASPTLADSALTPSAGAQRALDKAVSALTTPGGSLAADQSRLLAQFDIGYVLVQAPVDPQLASELNDISGLRPYSTTNRYSLWQLTHPPARVAVREPSGTIVPVPSGAIGVAGEAAPAAGGTLMLSEPAEGWKASVNGHALAAVPSPAGSWAQAFRLPSGGGTLTVGQSGLARDLVLILELLAFLVVAALALPGLRLAEQDVALAATPPDSRAGDRAADRASSRTPPRRAAARTDGVGAAATGAGHREAEPASARTAVMDMPGRQDDGLAAAGLTGAGPSPAEQGSLAAMGRMARSRLAGRQRNEPSEAASATRQQTRAAESPYGDLHDGAPTTALAAGSGNGDRGGRAERRAGRRGGFLAGGKRRADDRVNDHGVDDHGADDHRADDHRADDHRADAASGHRDDGRLADAWPYNSGAQQRNAGGSRNSGRHSYGSPGDGASDAGAAGRGGQYEYPMGSGQPARQTGPPGRAWSYQDEAGDGLSGRRDGGGDESAWSDGHGTSRWSGGSSSGSAAEYGASAPAAGWQSPSGSRSPSGRSPSGGDWPYAELDDSARRDRQESSNEATPWRTEPGTRAYRLPEPRRPGPAESGGGRDTESDIGRNGQPARSGFQRAFTRRGGDQAGPGTPPTGLPSTSGYAGETPDTDGTGGDKSGGRRGRRGGGRHGGGRSAERSGRRSAERQDGSDRDTGSRAWGSAGSDELEPLPPREWQGRGSERRGVARPGEDTRGWGQFGDEPADQHWGSGPADYEPEYEGDSW